MKNRKLYQLFIASVISATMMTSGISVSASDFSDDTSAQEQILDQAKEEEAPAVDDGSEFQADAAKAADLAVSSTNFPDAKFRKYVLDNLDTNGDKKLSDTEIKAVTKLDVSGLGIANLKGVEKFTALTELNASGNKLKAVDVTKNTKLTYLNLSKNSLSGTLNLSKCTKLEIVIYSNNSLTKVTMPNKKYLKNLDYIDASYNKFTTQANAGLNIGNSDILVNLSQIDASHNAITSFNCAGFRGMIDLRNNKITKLSLSNATEGCLATSLFIDGNTLSKTSSVDFTPEWISEPQQFSCDASVASKVKMVKAKISAGSAWDKITLNIGSSSQDATYKLERKTGNGAYTTVKTWAEGELDDPEFGDAYEDTTVAAGTTYTYRLTATVKVKDKDKNEKTWSNSAELSVKAAPKKPTVSVKSTKKGVASVSWSGTDVEGYNVYYGTKKNSVKTALVKGTTAKSKTKKLKSGKTYYFRVIGYKTVDGKKVYTSYSSVKGIKVK